MDNKSFIVYILLFGLLVFSGAVIAVSFMLPTHDQLFVFLTGVAGNFAGALFTWVQVKKNDDSK